MFFFRAVEIFLVFNEVLKVFDIERVILFYKEEILSRWQLFNTHNICFKAK